MVIPTWNRAGLVARAVRSALSQDWPALEVLVVDDASQDDTQARLAELDDPRLRVIRQPRNGGVARARNRGIAEARGDLIAFLDSDDEWLPGKLRLQVEALRAAPPGVALVYGGVEELVPGGPPVIARPQAFGRVFPAILERNVLHGFGSNGMVRREALEAVGGFDPDMPAAEDWEFLMRAARFFDVTAADAPVMRYHNAADVHEGAIRRSRAARANLEARRMLLQRWRPELRAAGLETAFLKESARRHLRAGFSGRGPAASLLLRALKRDPGAAEIYLWLASCGLPGRWGDVLRRGRPAA